MKQLIDLLLKRVLTISIFVCSLTHFFIYFFIYFDMSCNALTCIQDSKKNKNENKNKLLTKTKKTKLRQIVSKFIIDLNWTNFKDSFAKFYDFATRSFHNFELLARSLNNNVINFFFTFVRTSFVYTFIKNKEREDAYK